MTPSSSSVAGKWCCTKVRINDDCVYTNECRTGSMGINVNGAIPALRAAIGFLFQDQV